jgi:hypothetical protein
MARPWAASFSTPPKCSVTPWRTGNYLATLGYRRLSVRPRHPRTAPAAQEAFKIKLRGDGSRRGP